MVSPMSTCGASVTIRLDDDDSAVTLQLVTGVAAAAASSLLYNGGLLLQADATRREPVGETVEPSLLTRLVRRRRWIAGSLIAVAGWPLQAFALTRAPLTVVQPTLAVGLVLPLALGARMLGEPLRRRDVLNVCLLVVGVTLLVAVAPPRTTASPPVVQLAAALAFLSVLVLAAFLLALRPRRIDRGTFLIVAAGVSFALASLATKLLTDAFTRHAWLACALWAAAVLATGAAGLLGEMSALQLRSASSVASLGFALETAVPVALSPLLFGESGNAGAATLGLRAFALAATLAAAARLTRTASVVEALAER